ncbi:hypothetical protein K523DRAFT_205191, partial [Schizophyllum commune Tattone D]
AEPLLQLMATFHLDSHLPPGTPTHHSGSTIDLCLVSEELSDALIQCRTGIDMGSDHLPLEVHLDATLVRSLPPPRPLYRQADWEAFTKRMGELIQVVPMSKPSPYSKRWWTKELTALRKVYKRAARKAGRRTATETDKADAAEAKRRYFSAIRRQKRAHWREWV